MQQDYLTIAEAARSLGLTEQAVRQRIARGQFPYRKLGRRVLIPAQELAQFLAALPGKTATETVAAVRRIGKRRVEDPGAPQGLAVEEVDVERLLLTLAHAQRPQRLE